MEWIDVHTHINMLEAAPEETIRLADEAGVKRLVTVGTGLEDHSKVVAMAEKYAPVVYGTLGFHPHDAKDYSPEAEAYMRAHLTDPRIIAVGEIGLDYYYDNSPRETQQQVFRRQMEIAAEYNLPIEIHTRDAEEDTVAILKEFSGRVRGLFHCFTGTQWLAEQGLALGYNISFSGVVTFRNADALRAVAKSVPLDRLHIETDAPFLTPMPFRGKKNAPHLMVHTAELLAELKGVSLDVLAAQTKENALKLFPKLKW